MQDRLSHLVEAPEALGVHVQQLARAGALVAEDLRTGCAWQARGASAAQHLGNRRGRDAEDRPQARRAVAAGRPGVQDPCLQRGRGSSPFLLDIDGGLSEQLSTG